MKRILAVLLVALLATGSVFANSNTEEAGNGVTTLKVLAYGDPADETSVSIVNLIERFDAANDDIEIEYDFLYDEIYHQKLQATLAGGEQLDLFYAWNGGFRHRAVFDAGEEIDQVQFLDADVKAAYDEGAFLEANEGGVLRIPEAKSAHSVFFANTELLAKYGFEVAKTYDELLAQAAAVEADGVMPVAYAGSESWCWDTFLFSQFMARMAGPQKVADLIGRKIKYTDPVVISVYEMIQKWFADGVFTELTMNTDYGTALAQFNNNEALYYFDGGWRGASITVPYTWEQLPALPGEVAPGVGNGGYAPGYSITKSASESPRRDAAVRLFNFLLSEEGARERALVAGNIPARTMTGDVEYRPGTEAQVPYINGLSDIAMTISDNSDGKINEYHNSALMGLGLGTITPEELAANTQEIVDGL